MLLKKKPSQSNCPYENENKLTVHDGRQVGVRDVFGVPRVPGEETAEVRHGLGGQRAIVLRHHAGRGEWVRF